MSDDGDLERALRAAVRHDVAREVALGERDGRWRASVYVTGRGYVHGDGASPLEALSALLFALAGAP